MERLYTFADSNVTETPREHTHLSLDDHRQYQATTHHDAFMMLGACRLRFHGFWPCFARYPNNPVGTQTIP